MSHLRERWEGARLSGNYTLEEWLDGDDDAAYFQTTLAPEGRRAIVKLIPEAAGDGAATLDLWNRIRQLRHPNLIELLDCGRADQSGETVLYVVFEAPDDTLASALNHAPLNRQESREVLDSVIDALRYLHAQGLALGALDPGHIVAVGDRIKLSTDALHDADTSSAYRDDVRLLGELWQEALMPASPKSPEIAAHAADPNPNSRWTLSEICAALGGPAVTAPAPAPRMAVSAPISAPPVAVSPVPVPPALPKDAPALPPSYGRASESAATKPFPRTPPRWIFAGAAGVVLLVIVLTRQHPTEVAPPPRIAAVSAAAKALVPGPSRKAAVPTAPKASPADSTKTWRVIAFTYRTRAAAAKKAQQLNRRHPGLNANVFSPMNKSGYYLVSLGGRMTHEEAVRLQRSARGKGLPRDLYVQNYSA